MYWLFIYRQYDCCFTYHNRGMVSLCFRNVGAFVGFMAWK